MLDGILESRGTPAQLTWRCHDYDQRESESCMKSWTRAFSSWGQGTAVFRCEMGELKHIMCASVTLIRNQSSQPRLSSWRIFLSVITQLTSLVQNQRIEIRFRTPITLDGRVPRSISYHVFPINSSVDLLPFVASCSHRLPLHPSFELLSYHLTQLTTSTF